MGPQIRGTTGAARVLTVANTGNSPLILSTAVFLNGANSSDFAVDPLTTTCVMSAGATLAGGQSCKIGILFTPSATGARSASLYFQDNTVTGTNTVQLAGTGILPSPAMSITSPTNSSSLKAGTPFTLSVSVTSTASPQPTGTVTFFSNGTQVGSPVTLSSGAASTQVTEGAAGTYTMLATYNGDANYAAKSVSESAVVAAIKIPVTIAFDPVASPASTCGPMSFSVVVSSKSGGTPTGTVQLRSGASLLGSATLNNGAAALSSQGLVPGSYTFVASYGGDSSHEPAVSSPVSITVPATSGSCGGGLPLGGPVL
jgi:hypothetical protein